MRLALVWLFTFCAFAGIAQTLTTTFTFTSSGYIGTPATATTPFQGQTFTNARITITVTGNTANRIYDSNNYCIQNDSSTVTISGLGTYQFPSSALHSQANVDPIKGVTGNTIGLWVPAPAFCNAAFPNVAVSIQRSTLWDMTSSLGPIQTTNNIYGQMAVPTSGGTLMFSPTPSVMSFPMMGFQAVFTGTPPAPTLTRSGVLSHIAAGGEWTTVITLVNNSSVAAPVAVVLHDDYGNILSLPVTITNQGTTQTTTTGSINATVKPNATLLISTGDGISSTSVGWADVLSSGVINGFAIFRQTSSNGLASEGTVPLESQFTAMTLPYDDSAGFLMGVALANLATTTANVTATVWDDSGNQIGIQNITIAGDGHTSFVLPTQIPVTAGKRGIVQFQGSGGLAGLGLRFSPFGTFTSVPTI